MLRLRPWPTLCLLLASALASLPALAQVRVWTLDPVHTRVAFAIDHAGFSRSMGTFSRAEGILHFDPADLSATRLQVEIPVASLELGDDKWNQATLARNLLDAETHPVATFVSSRVEVLGDRHATLHGVLTLRGQAREVALDVTVNAVKRHPLPPFRRTAGFSATATLQRSDFGMVAWRSMIGDTVELRIEAEATVARGADADGLPAAGNDDGDDTPADADADPAPATPPQPTP